MIGELLEVVTKLFEVSDSLKQAEYKTRERIADYFLQIEECLRISAEQLQSGMVPDDKWGELQYYSKNLPSTIGEEIGQSKANELSSLLQQTVDNMPTDSDIRAIKAAAGTFKALAVTVTTNSVKTGEASSSDGTTQTRKSGSNTRRRAFISTAAGSLIGLTAGWFARQHSPSINPIRWKMVSFLGENSKDIILYNAPQMISNRVKEMTYGGFIIELNPTGKPATAQTLSDVHNGTNIQCSYSGIYYSDEYRALFFGSAIPFGLDPQEQTAWLYYKQEAGEDKPTYMQTVYEKL